MKTELPHPESPEKQAAGKFSKLSGWLLLLLVAVGLAIAGSTLPLQEPLKQLDDFIGGMGPWAPAIYILVYIAATLLMIPGSLLTPIAGFSFGLVKGTNNVSIGSTAGAALAFLLARYLARRRISRSLEQHRYLAAIDKALEQGSWKTVALMRLSPAIPFNLQNYLWGLTPVRFSTYLLASWISMLPGTFLYVYLGFIPRKATGMEPLEWILLGGGLVATLVAIIYITRLARRALEAERDN
ncbi:MAG: TVP38/TMEM64 family protein [Planctomycetota bacterium]|nr:TVP38/TMEM64 family protein [Planctomycetota bacterium]